MCQIGAFGSVERTAQAQHGLVSIKGADSLLDIKRLHPPQVDPKRKCGHPTSSELYIADLSFGMQDLVFSAERCHDTKKHAADAGFRC